MAYQLMLQIAWHELSAESERMEVRPGVWEPIDGGTKALENEIKAFAPAWTPETNDGLLRGLMAAILSDYDREGFR